MKLQVYALEDGSTYCPKETSGLFHGGLVVSYNDEKPYIVWREHKNMILTNLLSKPLTMTPDGRCDLNPAISFLIAELNCL